MLTSYDIILLYFFSEWKRVGNVHFVTFEDIPINKGGGMFLNGSFYAPVDGLYW